MATLGIILLELIKFKIACGKRKIIRSLIKESVSMMDVAMAMRRSYRKYNVFIESVRLKPNTNK